MSLPKLPRWATGGSAVVIEPTEGEKDLGWPVGFRPPAHWVNWLARQAYGWLLGLQSLLLGNWLREETVSTGTVNKLYYGAQWWIALGDASGGATPYELQRSQYTPDSWVQQTVPTSSLFFLDGFFDGTYYTAAGQNGALIYATDPSAAWTNNTQTITGSIICFDFGGGYYLFGTSNGDIYYRATDPTGTFTLGINLPAQVNDLKYNGTEWIAVCDNGRLYHTTDPTAVTWTENTNHPFYAGNKDINGVAWNGTKWAICGEDGIIATADSASGTFTDKTPSYLLGVFNLEDIEIDDAANFAVFGGAGNILYSMDDGENWEVAAVQKGNGYTVRGPGFSADRNMWACGCSEDGTIRKSIRL